MSTKEKAAVQLKHAYIFWPVMIVLLFAIDQLTKYGASWFLKPMERLILIPQVLELFYVENKGMAFGMLEGRQMLFCVFCILFLAVIGYLFVRIPKTSYYLPLIITGGIISAGALGNFADRIIHGYVIDFIYFSLIDFPVFNTADIYVTCGAAVLVIFVIFYYKDEDFAFISPGKDHKGSSL